MVLQGCSGSTPFRGDGGGLREGLHQSVAYVGDGSPQCVPTSMPTLSWDHMVVVGGELLQPRCSGGHTGDVPDRARLACGSTVSLPWFDIACPESPPPHLLGVHMGLAGLHGAMVHLACSHSAPDLPKRSFTAPSELFTAGLPGRW